MSALLWVSGQLEAQLYQQPKIVPTGNWPAFVTSDETLGGGLKPSLIYIDQGATPGASVTHILLNDGKGNFTPSQTFNTGGSVLSVGDFDGDGRFDVGWVTCTTVCSGYYAPGRGDGTYGAAVLLGQLISGVQLPVAGYLSAAAMHRDAASRSDLVVADSANNQIYVLSVEGQGASVAGTPVAGGVGQIDYEAADYDGDGNIDLIFPGSVSQQEILLPGNGDGTFKGPKTFPALGQVFHSKVLPSDSSQAVSSLQLYCEGLNGQIHVYSIAANGTISATPVASTGNEDGRSGAGGQVIVRLMDGTESYLYTATPLGISLLEAGADGVYSLKGIYDAGPRRVDPVLGYFNGGTALDFVFDSPEGIAILPSAPNGTLESSASFAAGQPAYSLALGEFTGSGVLDAVVATGVPQVQLMNGDGAGSFLVKDAPTPAGAAQTNEGRTVWSHVVAGDFDGDKKLDAAVSLDGPVETDLGPCCSYAAGDDGMSVLFGDGTGDLSAPMAEGPVDSGPHYGELLAADLNGDGYSDLINYDFDYVGGYRGSATIRTGGMVLNNAFSVGQNSGYLFPYQQVATGYFRTGRTSAPDVVLEADTSALTFSALKNAGDGTYTNGQQSFAMPANAATPTSGSSVLPSTGLYPSAMALADFDGDGKGDLLVLYHNLASDPANPSPSLQNLLYIFWGNGDGTFEATPEIATMSRNYYQMAVADVTGDGEADLVMSDGYLVSVLAGNGTRAGFAHETHYLAGMGINGLAIADVNGDGKLDIVTANGGAVLSSGVVNGGVLAANAEVNTGGVTVLGSGAYESQTLLTVSGSVTASPEPSVYGASITMVATVTPPANDAAPGGTVAFSIDGVLVGTGTVANGAATYVVTSATIAAAITNPIYWDGKHTLSAAYSGDGNYATATFTGSHTVVGQPTVTTLTDLVQNIFYGQEIGFTNGINALVGATAADPTTAVAGTTLTGGDLLVYVDGNLVCTLPYGSVQACPDPPFENFPVGQHTTYAMYSGNDYYATSNSTVYTVTIAPDPTTATVTSSLNPSTLGQAVTFTATIADQYAVAQGTVSFLDGTTVIGSGPVNADGVATVTTSVLAVGVHPINVMYVPISGDYLPSSAVLLNGQTVNPVVPPPPPPPPPGSVTFTLTVNPTAISVGVGNSVAVQVAVTAMNGFSQPVQLGCSGLPHETTCTFVQGLIGVGGGTTGMIVSPAAPHTCGSSAPDFVAPNLKAGLGGMALSLMTLFGLRRRRRLVRGLALLVALCVLPLLAGCGSGCKDFGTEPTDYTFTVTATSMGSPVVSLTQAVKMKVHL